MTDIQTKMIIALVAHHESLVERLATADTWEERDHAERDLENFLKKYPNVDRYDDKGNYVGPISNENGWTP